MELIFNNKHAKSTESKTHHVCWYGNNMPKIVFLLHQVPRFYNVVENADEIEHLQAPSNHEDTER